MSLQILSQGGAEASFRKAFFMNTALPATNSWSTGSATWTLTGSQNEAGLLTLSGTASNSVVVVGTPDLNKLLIVINNCGQNATVKATGQTGVTIATGKKVLLIGTGTDFSQIFTS